MYEIIQIIAVIADNMATGKLIIRDSPIKGLSAKNVQEYSPIITADTKKITSQIRRCQKRVKFTGLIVPPTTYISLVDIMTIVLCFYKWRSNA